MTSNAIGSLKSGKGHDWIFYSEESLAAMGTPGQVRLVTCSKVVAVKGRREYLRTPASLAGAEGNREGLV